MAKNQATANIPLLYAFDAGNGTCKGLSSQSRDLIEFEPVMARLTSKKGTPDDEKDKPTYSLQIDGDTWVFGVNDVYSHGVRTSIRRLNNIERYGKADYFNLLYVLFLHAFAAHRGNSEAIRPTGVISLPISVYNRDDMLGEIRETLVKKHNLIDYEGCELRLSIEDKRLVIVPESYGALMHYAYDPKNKKKRSDADTTGTTLVIDVGYETTDVSLFEGLKYQRDASYTIERAGMGVVARAVTEHIGKQLKNPDVSRVDRALQAIAGVAMGAPKTIEPTPGVFVDVTEIYDQQIADLGIKIAQAVETNSNVSVTRAVLAGGGEYHLKQVIRSQMSAPIVSVPDPDGANVRGAFTMLNIQAGQ